MHKETVNTMEYANRPCTTARCTRALVAAGGMLALCALLTLPNISGARQSVGHLAVGATVKAYVQLKATNPAQFIVANKDTNLGYIDVPNKSNPMGSQLSVTTNDRAGYTLAFQVASDMQAMFTSIQVSGLGTTVTLPASGGKVSLPYSSPSNSFTVTYRFVLAKKIKDGTFAWPLTISVQPN